MGGVQVGRATVTDAHAIKGRRGTAAVGGMGDRSALSPFTVHPVKALHLPHWSNPLFLIFDIRAQI